jgi:hypothetical protein
LNASTEQFCPRKQRSVNSPFYGLGLYEMINQIGVFAHVGPRGSAKR